MTWLTHATKGCLTIDLNKSQDDTQLSKSVQSCIVSSACWENGHRCLGSSLLCYHNNPGR